MGRPEKPIQSYDCAAGGFACLLRGARERADSPDYRKMAETDSCYVSYSQLSKAASGNVVPTWQVTESYINSLNELSMKDGRLQNPPEDVGMWFERWKKAITREEGEGTVPLRRRRARHARPGEPTIAPIFADPTRATTPEEFIREMIILKKWADLSSADITKRSGLARSTLSDTLNRPTLPRWSFVEKFVLACGARKADLGTWRTAWGNIGVIAILTDAPTPGDGLRIVEEKLKLAPDSASERLAETVAYLQNADKATNKVKPKQARGNKASTKSVTRNIPRQRPAWLQDIVEGRPDHDLVGPTVPELLLRKDHRHY